MMSSESKANTFIDTDRLQSGLVEKLREECEEAIVEFDNADTPKLMEECADVLEVMRGMAVLRGLDPDVFLTAIGVVAEKKRIERGGFTTGVFLQGSS